jgi:hypothetical protein
MLSNNQRIYSENLKAEALLRIPIAQKILTGCKHGFPPVLLNI